MRLKLTPKRQSDPVVDVYIHRKRSVIHIDGWHEEFEHKNSIVEAYNSLEKLLKFALSKSCKILITKANGKAYKWDLYSFENGEWKFYSTTGLLIYNYFGKRTKEEKASALFEEGFYPRDIFGR